LLAYSVLGEILQIVDHGELIRSLLIGDTLQGNICFAQGSEQQRALVIKEAECSVNGEHISIRFSPYKKPYNLDLSQKPNSVAPADRDDVRV